MYRTQIKENYDGKRGQPPAWIVFWFNSECSLMDIHIGLYTVTLKFNEKPYAKRL